MMVNENGNKVFENETERNSFKKSCEDMAALIESCWDENNPDDGLTFDERLARKLNKNNEMKDFFIRNSIGD